jgi:hypothetical protein
MSNSRRSAETYCKVRGLKFPASFRKVNSEASLMMGITFFVDLLTGVFIGWLGKIFLNLVFAANNLPNLLVISKIYLLFGFMGVLFLGFVWGCATIYGGRYDEEMDEEQTMTFLSKFFGFAARFSPLLMICGFIYMFFGV